MKWNFGRGDIKYKYIEVICKYINILRECSTLVIIHLPVVAAVRLKRKGWSPSHVRSGVEAKVKSKSKVKRVQTAKFCESSPVCVCGPLNWVLVFVSAWTLFFFLKQYDSIVVFQGPAGCLVNATAARKCVHAASTGLFLGSPVNVFMIESMLMRLQISINT